MATYKPTTYTTGSPTTTGWVNPANAYDTTSFPDTTTYATGSTGTTGVTTRKDIVYSGFASLTTNAVRLYLRHRYNINSFIDQGYGGNNGVLRVSYTFDNWATTQNALLYADGETSGTAQLTESVVLAVPANANLANLKVRIEVFSPCSWDSSDIQTFGTCLYYLYDIYVDATGGVTYTVNAISGSTTLQAGHSAQYSTTVTNDSTNSCTWSIVSGGGTLSGAVNDGTSSRVTWTAPNTSGGTAVLKATSTKDTSKYAQITVSVPAITVNTPSGATTLYAGLSSQYTTTTTNDNTNYATWSIVSGGGSLSGAAYDATNSRVTLSAPTASGTSIVLRATSRDDSKTAQLTVTVPTVGVTLTVGPNRRRVGERGWYQVTVTGHSDNRVNWSATGGSFDATQGNGVNWTAPTTRGKYIISGSHVYDASKTFSYAVYVDYFYPNNYTVGVADAAQVGCDLVSGGQAIDEQLNSYANANSYWVSEGQGESYGYYDLYDFPDTPNLVSTNLVLYYSSYSTDIYYSIDGGQNWVFATSAPGSGNASPLIITVAPGSIYNLNQLRVRFRLNSWCERKWNRDTQQWDNVSAGGWVYLYEIRAEPTQRAYSAVTGTSDRGTTPTPLFMPGQFQPLTGTMSGAGTSPVALTGPGTSTTPVAIPFFLGASLG